MKGIVDADTKSERQGMSITILSLQSFIHTQDKKNKEPENVCDCTFVFVRMCVLEIERDKKRLICDVMGHKLYNCFRHIPCNLFS